MRALEKKMRQITELKELKVGGKQLEKNQLDKIEVRGSAQFATCLENLAHLISLGLLLFCSVARGGCAQGVGGSQT